MVEMRPVLKTYFIEKDPDCALFEYLPRMATTCKGSIGALLSARFCERFQKVTTSNSCANQIPLETLILVTLLETTTVLRINQTFMKFMHLKYPNILKQRFPTFDTVITVADNLNEQDDVKIDSD